MAAQGHGAPAPDEPAGARGAAGRTPAKRLYGIQYLRAVAALGVVAVHATDRLPILGLGVSLFFLLSGFLMVAITDESSRPGPFLRDRLLRIVPVYWVVTAAMVAVQLTGLLWHGLLSKTHIAASLLFIPAVYPGDGRMLPLVAQGWTLNYEMLFYTLFASTLLLPRRWQIWVLSGLICALTAAGFLFHPQGAALYTWSHPISLLFLAGAWIGVAWQQGRRLWPLLVAAIALTFLFGAAMPVHRHFGILTGCCLLVALLAAVLMLERRGEGVRPFRLPLLLGDASYSIYLWQSFPLMVTEALARRFGLPPALEAALFVSAAVVGGVAAYFLIERPLLRLAGRVRRYRHGAPIPAGP